MNIKKSNLIHISFLAFISIFLFTCAKKHDENNDGLSKNLGISMKIDGAISKSTMTKLFTQEQETSEIGKYHYVSMLGMNIISEKEDDLESQGLYITIPAGKFKNPKGTYQVIPREVEPNHAWAVYNKAFSANYLSGKLISPTTSVGTIEITDFEIGKQTIMGFANGLEGYTKLSGNFQFKLHDVNAMKS